MVILNIILIFLIVIFIAVFINIIEGHKDYKKISFKETMDLLNIPIITFVCNKKKLHFLFDSGSSYSHISPEAISYVGEKPENAERNIQTIGAGGTLNNNKHCTLKLSYNGEFYNSDFIVTEQLAQQLEAIKKDFNIEIHGILGGDFLNKYNYVIDFKELIVYSKKNAKK
jgi:hypothetical protein